VTPIVQAEIEGKPETVGWTWERPGGGRAFGFSGLHFHRNWAREEYRRLVTQGVLWTVGLPIPAEGLDVKVDAGLFELSKTVRVEIVTEQGTIEVELDRARAPITVSNFLRYVDAKLYDGGQFHRTVRADNQPDNKVKIAVIQAGVNPKEAKKEFPPIRLERTNKTKLKHLDGTISMARDGPDTATGDFFICVGDQPELDFGGKRNPDKQGFAAFGRVVSGLEVVRKINQAAARGQTLEPPMVITSVRRKP
jgi:peptidyl-prolyl cis-trans isomerase A (cyclophilin A)